MGEGGGEMRFEYRVTVLEWPPVHREPTKAASEAMNVMGTDGWEMVGVCQRVDDTGWARQIAMFWKRAKNEGAE